MSPNEPQPPTEVLYIWAQGRGEPERGRAPPLDSLALLGAPPPPSPYLTPVKPEKRGLTAIKEGARAASAEAAQLGRVRQAPGPPTAFWALGPPSKIERELGPSKDGSAFPVKERELGPSGAGSAFPVKERELGLSDQGSSGPRQGGPAFSGGREGGRALAVVLRRRSSFYSRVNILVSACW